MEPFDLIIRNGRIATASDIFECDIGIREGCITALEEGLTGATEIIDAAGKWVTPGGVDGHCHIDQPTSDGTRMADDFLSGTTSAVHGGTTTIIPFACQFKGQSLNDVVADYHARAEGKAVIDYAFHLIVSDPSPNVLETELPNLIANGYTHFKLYMTYDDMKLNDRQMLDVLDVARRHGAMVMIHAENSDCIAWLTDRLEQAGKTAPHYHAVSRPPVVEREATYRAIAFSDLMDTPILIVHVSGEEATKEIRRAQERGLRIYGETCPQYLFLTSADLQKDGSRSFLLTMRRSASRTRKESRMVPPWKGFDGFPTGFQELKPGCRCFSPTVSWMAGSISRTSSRLRRPILRICMASKNPREQSPLGRMLTS